MPRPLGLMLLAVVIGMAGLGPPAAAEPAVGSTGEARRAPETRSEVQLSFAPLVKAAAPAVVNIYTRRVVESRASPLFDDPFFRRFFGDMMMPEGQRRRILNALGSGVVVDPEGLIGTTVHVVDGAAALTASRPDRRELETWDWPTAHPADPPPWRTH